MSCDLERRCGQAERDQFCREDGVEDVYAKSGTGGKWGTDGYG